MSASRKLRRANQAKAVGVLPELTTKMEQVVSAGQQLAEVSAQIHEVNGKLQDLDSLITKINEISNLVNQALEEGREVHREQARQRYATLQMLYLATGVNQEVLEKWDQEYRDEFDKKASGNADTK